MKALSKDDNAAFRKTFFRDCKILLAVVFISSMAIGFTLYLVGKGIID